MENYSTKLKTRKKSQRLTFLLFSCSLFHVSVAHGQTRFPEIDATINRFMQVVDATCGVVAVNFDGQLIYAQGFGFSDSKLRVPARADVSMRLASCSKPFTRVAIMKLIDQQKLSFDTRIFDYLRISAADQTPIADPRLKEITIRHLLEHRGGWDREASLDPMYEIGRVRDELNLTKQPDKREIVQFMLQQPLQVDPGTEKIYSNFGYLLLGMAIEKATQTSYIESVRKLVGAPLGIDDLRLSATRSRSRHPREVHYPREGVLDLKVRDSASGLVCSAPSLCKLMNAYWMDGVKRDSPRDVYFYQIGTHPYTTTTVMEQRLDGIDYVIMLNSRRNDHYDEDGNSFRDEFNDVLDKIKHDFSIQKK